MFTSIRSFWGAVGVMLFLIALYLVLVNSQGAQRLLSSSTAGGVQLIRSLQGR